MGGIPEVRVSAAPVDVVGLNLDIEEDSPEYLAMLDAEKDVDDEAPEDDVTTAVQSPSKSKKTTWTPYQFERMWIPETLVELGVPALLEEWNQAQRDKAELKARPLKKSNASKLPREVNRIDQYFGASRPHEPPVPDPSRVPEPLKQAVADTSASRLVAAAKKPPRNPLRRAISEISPDLKQYFKPAKVIPGVRQVALNKSKHHLDSPSPSPTRELPTTLPGNTAIVIGSVADPISIDSSPLVFADVGSVSAIPKTPTRNSSKTNNAQTSPPVRELEQSVTQRSSRRVRKKLERAKTEGDLPSNDFALPLDEVSSPNAVDFSVKKSDYMRATKTVLPPELTTGLKTDFGRKKVLAAPRGSLAGTWKEIDVDLVDDVAMTKSRRPPRVSCVDLAAE
ncbi:uncharacterized protein AB675_2093 [Cyphellophora attinorum]|uniref:Holliday junction resolvase Gen1 C-terminal domain-containing protein n=1 Tax=Cyphellophora attinorum TaxID=1664694 RepID=A0A0N0NPS4_9EURO|nr:uncharacterized protein AB675_2093 [Phialophora attinorum]KPI43081.1 hypothetical protein AB675_2093 [Phialophora attinorum]